MDSMAGWTCGMEESRGVRGPLASDLSAWEYEGSFQNQRTLGEGPGWREMGEGEILCPVFFKLELDVSMKITSEVRVEASFGASRYLHASCRKVVPVSNWK